MADEYYRSDDPLAYGDDHSRSRGFENRGSERSLVGDTLKKFKDRLEQQGRPSQDPYGYSSSASGQQQSYGQSQQYGQYSQNTGNQPHQTQQPWGQPPSGQPAYGNQQQYHEPGQPYDQGSHQPHSQDQRPTKYQNSAYAGPNTRPDMAQKVFSGLQGAIHSIGTDVAGILGTKYPYGQAQSGTAAISPAYQQASARNRFDSFASPREGNQVKWFVDGCGYMWAVSQALEAARESIWILDWWLSPELYLRRPPAANEEWRLDRVLQRAAQRGVKINVIVYKEVTQALTLSSSHTKNTLEALSPNISVFRHPDHLPDMQTAESSLASSLQGLKLDAAGASRLGPDALKGAYGFKDDVILYWAHHEKLLLVDGHSAFMGGLDLCFGRWDTHQHPIVDAHPTDLNKIVFPGQDYNNARIADFDDVAHPFQNKLNRLQSSRMGWSDISINLEGPCVDDLKHHFVDRWNFIYDEKYNIRRDTRYARLPPWGSHSVAEGSRPPQPESQHQSLPAQNFGQVGSQGYTPPPWQASPQPSVPSDPSGTSTQFQRPHYDIEHGQYPPPPPGAPPQMFSSSQPGPGHLGSSIPPQPTSGVPELSSQQRPQNYGVYPQQEGPQSSNAPASSAAAAYTPGQSQTSAQTQSQQSNNSYNPTSQLDQENFGPSSHTSEQPAPSQTFRPPQTQSAAQTPALSSTAQPSYPGTNSNPQDNYQSSLPQNTQQYHAYHSQAPGQVPQPNTVAPVDSSQLPSGQVPYQAYHGEAARGLDDGPQRYEHEYNADRGFASSRVDKYKQEGKMLGSELGAIGSMVYGKVESKLPSNFRPSSSSGNRPSSKSSGEMRCQLLRSCTKWSNGTPTEHSIQNAYIDVIRTSDHFVYIENQFFITATGDRQHPVKNMIGAAIVDRVLRAARERTPWKMIVMVPAIPGFAGDFVGEQSLGTRAICEFQYNSICRGGHSIMEEIARAGVNPMDYIRFYNLRNYDRINSGTPLSQAQQYSGVGYEDARMQQEDRLGSGYAGQSQMPSQSQPQQHPYQQNAAQQYQNAAQNLSRPGTDNWDSVSSCYMLGGEDIRGIPWNGPPEAELDAFVSEELYIHSKVMIADDRYVICGSSNLNDRSMLGTHDSEIALLISDSHSIPSTMAGRPWQASRFAASLRRQLTRKHLGLIRAQDMQRPDDNFMPLGVPNTYDWGSPEDNVVADPLSDTFQSLWNTRARTNTEVYRKAFRAIPDDYIRTWTEYKEFFDYYFHQADPKDPYKNSSRVEYGHVVRDDFPGGAKELKELLSRVKGTVVEMPLCFLQNEKIAKEGVELNEVTEVLYT